MCYILRHSSIFLSVKKNDYFQVSGLPLNVVLQKPIFVSAKARKQRPFFNKEECSKVKSILAYYNSLVIVG